MKSLVLGVPCKHSSDLLKAIYSRQLTPESSVLGTCYLVNALSAKLNQVESPDVNIMDNLLQSSATVDALSSMILCLSYDLAVSSMEEDPFSADPAIDTLSLGVLFSLPSSSSPSNYVDLLATIKHVSDLIAVSSSAVLPVNYLNSKSNIAQESLRRARFWSFPSLTSDSDVMALMRKRHAFFYSFLSAARNNNTSSGLVSNSSSQSNHIAPSEASYLPSWTAKDLSLSVSIGGNSINTVASETSNESTTGYDSPTAPPPQQSCNSPILASDVDVSKLTNLKRNTTSRRLSSRRAHTASETLIHHSIAEAHDIDEENIRIPPATSIGIRSSRESDISNDADTESPGIASQSSSRRSSRAGQMLRRRQRFPANPSLSPNESENENIDSDLVTKSFQDESLSIAQARLAFVSEQPISHPNDELEEGKVMKSNSLNSTPERSGNTARRFQRRSRLSSANQNDQLSDSSSRRGSRSGSQEFEEVDMLSLTNQSNKTSSPDATKSPELDPYARHPPRSIPKVTASRNPRRSLSSESVNGIVPDGIASIDTSPVFDALASVSSSVIETPTTDTAVKASVEYLDSSQIKPSDHPSSELASGLRTLESETDWEKLFYCLNTIRSLVLHHQSMILSSGKLHALVIGVMKQIDNLRSAVAKNAILTMGDMYQGLGRSMESEVVASIPTLIKRFGVSSSFLTESAETALQQMCRSVSATCALNALLLGIDNRNASIRGKVMSLVSGLVDLKGVELIGSKELETLKSKLHKLYSDSSPEARAHCRNVARLFIAKDMVSISELEGLMTIEAVAKSLREGSMPGEMSRSNSANLSSSSSSARSLAELSIKSGSSSRKSSINQSRFRQQMSRQSSTNSEIPISDVSTPESGSLASSINRGNIGR
jgi:hypothetical protein